MAISRALGVVDIQRHTEIWKISIHIHQLRINTNELIDTLLKVFTRSHSWETKWIASVFGKQILNQQTTEWASHYVNYKALKKIINSLQSAYQSNERSLPHTPAAVGTSRTPNADALQANNYPEFLQQQKAAFFFKLERELEKVNAFYLQKEKEFKVRLRTLNDKKRILLGNERKISSASASLITLTEAFQKFQQDLNKLQQFVEINATGFRKILKKWDKRSKSRTKELYLSRQVEIQPFFNRDIIAELADNVDNNLSELRTLIHGLSSTTSSSTPTSPERKLSISELGEPDVMNDIEAELFKSIMKGATSTVQEVLDNIRQRPSDDDKDLLSRVFWRACSEENSSIESLHCLVDTNMVNFKYVDDISDRTCLHESSIVGRLPLMKICVEHNVKVNCSDVYGRRPLHYVCMYGHNEAATYLLSKGADCECFDHDGFSPLIYAITNGNTECVEILLKKGALIEPQNERDHNHIPLSLACQYGHKDIALLLLDKGARIIPDADGLYPLHLTSREGHHELSKILTRYGVFLDTPDNEGWSPIFYAASEGHIECVDVLIQAGCQVNITDESGRSPIYYAAWEGHIECINKLHLAGGRVETVEPRDEPMTDRLEDPVVESNVDPIPSLTLPPPIIPLPIYGHNYLDKKYHIQITLGHPSTKPQRPPVLLYGNSHISSLKLLITPNPGMGMIPLSIILPLGDDREVFSFQADSLENFSLDFDIFPTFGSKVIGKGVALSHVFDIPNGRGRRNNLVTGGTGGKYICPLLDTHLKVVGELSFEFAIVKPFQGVRLEIGGQVETYWKSLPEQPLNVSGNIPSFITASSLSGEYIQIVVQVTRDMIAVVYPEWMLPVNGFDLSVSDVTYKQFESINRDHEEKFDFSNAASSAELQKMIHQAYLSLEEVLAKLPPSIGVNLEIKYPTVYEMSRYWFSDVPDINSYVDTILQTVYDHVQNQIASNTPGVSNNKSTNRSVTFSSFNPAICTVLNWKQPNYAVFFNSFCGFENENFNRGKKRKERDGNINEDATYEEIERDKRCTSIKEAVKFAKINNLLGVICEATLLVRVPSLITSIKQAGLILTTFGTANNDSRNIRIQERYGVDAVTLLLSVARLNNLMPKHEFLTPKAIANRIKAKGLQKLKWYCQMCEKQCRDENGYQCHIRSESHLRQMDLLKENPTMYIQGYSKQFHDDFVKLLSRRWGTKRVFANLVYQEYISDRNHIHMNGTIWVSLTEYVKYLGKEGICNVDETPKGWYISWVDNSPKALARQAFKYLIQEQIERARGEAKESVLDDTKFTELKRDNEEDKIKLNISLAKSETPISTSATSPTSSATASTTNASAASTTHTSISFNKPISQKVSLNETERKKRSENLNGNGNGNKPNFRRKDEQKSRDYKDRDNRRDYRERDRIDREKERDYREKERDYREKDRDYKEKDRDYREKDRKHRERGRDRSYDRSHDRESKRLRRD
ncbi:11064_t:CDS:10 [Acaulospora morrowiae]|uniref:11064_t:CDS:1 n=1 Tax=Acaulospora morrowiae TaxID=94023 RepID=A0A9N9FTB3_9GLOM|nr:11064_t:CDS:10 [Acaulospora morrowiae]